MHGNGNKRSWPDVGGAMAEAVRMKDWSLTPLGDPSGWGAGMRYAVDMLLRMPVPAIAFLGDAGIALYNDAFRGLIGDLHPQLFGAALAGVPAPVANIARAARRVQSDGAPVAALDESLAVCRDGVRERLSVDLNGALLPGAGMAGVLIILTDRTQHKKAESLLRQNEAQLAAIFSRAKVGLSVISQSGRFLRVNDELCNMLGRTREQLLSCDVPSVTDPRDVGKSMEMVGRLLATGEPVSLEKRYRRPDGSLIYANSVLTLLDRVDDQPGLVLGVTVDLTERKLAEQALAESESRFRSLAETSPALIWQLGAWGGIEYVNPAFHDFIGKDPRELSGKAWQGLIHPEDLPAYSSVIADALHSRSPFHTRMRVCNKIGEWRWLDSHAAPLLTGNRQYAGHVGISIDVTAEVHAENELRTAGERMKLAVEGTGDAVWDWDISNDRITHSKRLMEIFGLRDTDEPFTRELWERRIHPDDRANVEHALRACLEGRVPTFSCEYRVRNAYEQWRWLLTRAVVAGRDRHGAPERMTGTLTDISDKRRSEEIIWRQANFDALTALPNVRLFRDRLTHEVRKAHRTDLPLALLFIDLDRFKEANDLLGHAVGDQLLAEAAKRLTRCVRESDTVARLGGDEFTAILTEIEDVSDVDLIAEKINASLATPFQIGNEVVYLSASIGITFYPHDAATADELISNADQAMYAAKNAGRNQFCYYTRTMQREAVHRLRIINDLRHALADNQFTLYYQPVVDLASEQVRKAEAFIRWDHPGLGQLAPAQFIQFAEESGLIREIGDWIFRQVTVQARQWTSMSGAPFQISLNASPVQFISRSNSMNWLSFLKGIDIPRHSILLEITESLLLNATSEVLKRLLQFRDAGIQVAIDDFGTGYSSISYLRKFSIDYLKIDPSFIRDMENSDGDRAVVRSVTAMAHALGLKVVAEGIETRRQKELLIDAGCDFGQGFFFSKPVPVAEFERRWIHPGRLH